MTAPEPLTLTLEEAAQLLGEQGLVLILDGASGAASRWSVRPWSAPRDWMKEELGATWPEVVGAARGRPVVARDEAAALRAENERLHAGLTRLVGMLDAANRDRAFIRLNDISSHLRRLAASEGQRTPREEQHLSRDEYIERYVARLAHSPFANQARRAAEAAWAQGQREEPEREADDEIACRTAWK